jgi:hypothetical protein
MNTHATVWLVAGDDWQFNATMLDPNGNPLDLTNAAMQWTLLDRDGLRALAATDFAITLGTTIGTCSVHVPKSSSTKLAAGVYSDFWRATITGFTQTLLEGLFNIAADPFTALPETLQASAERAQVVELVTKKSPARAA